jgi:hypothetical protein
MAGPRQVEPVDIDMLPGVLMDRSVRKAKGRWTAADNVRWQEGLPEKMGGSKELVLTNDSGEPQLMKGRMRACLEWSSLDGQNWVAVGTHAKLYLINNDRLFDITPIRRNVTLVDTPFTTVAGSRLVIVQDPRHDAGVGDYVRFQDALAIGGLTIAGEFEIVGVLDGNRYQIEHELAATLSTTGGGTPIAEYDLNIGLESDGILTGFGTGDYGEGTWGTPREDSTFRGSARIWSLDAWGEDLLAAPNGGTLYHWDRTRGPGSRAEVVPGAPQNIEFIMVGPDDRHVLAYGTNTLSGTGAQDKMFLRWCAGDNFKDWVATSTNDAGSKRLDIGSRLVTAVKTRTQILLFTNKHLYGQSFVAGSKVYDFLPLGSCEPPISRMAVIDRNGIVEWMGTGSFHRFDGTAREIRCDITDYVFGALNKEMGSKVHARLVLERTEVHYSFTSTDNDENDREAIYNWDEDCWYPCSIARECGLDSTAFHGVPLCFQDGAAFLHETGTDRDLEDPMVAYLESWEGQIADGGYDMLMHELIPDFRELEGSIDVSVFGREEPQAPRMDSDVQVVTAATELVQDIPFRARRIGLRVESHELGDQWRMDTWQVKAGPYGRRA